MINQHTFQYSGILGDAKYDPLFLMIIIALGWHIVFQLYKKSGKIKGF